MKKIIILLMLLMTNIFILFGQPTATLSYPDLITEAGTIEVHMTVEEISSDIIAGSWTCQYNPEHLTFMDVIFPNSNFPANEWTYGSNGTEVGMSWLPEDFLPELFPPDEVFYIIQFEWDGECTDLLWGEGTSMYNSDFEEYDLTLIDGSVCSIDPCNPPTNLIINGPSQHNTASFCWQAPEIPSGNEWIHWDSGENNNGIGIQEGETFFVASHWSSFDLITYDGMYISKLAFHPYNGASSDYVLKIWTGPNAETEVFSEAVSIIADEWNIFELSSSILIDATLELWFGYEVTQNSNTEYPAGTDSGPAYQGYGDMISMDGINWVSMSADYGLDYNWNMQAYFTEDGEGINKPLVKTVVENPVPASIKINNQASINPIFKPLEKELLGYKVFRDGDSIAYITETCFEDTDLPQGWYEYYVTAVYDNCESEPSNLLLIPVFGEFEAFYDNFDEYNTNEQLVCQGAEEWTTWSNNPCSLEDPYVTTEQYNSANNSIIIEEANDLVHPIANYTLGVYGIQFYIYIPNGKQGYFAIMSEFDGGGSSCAMQVFFDLDGYATVDAGGLGSASFSYDSNTWITVRIIADLNYDIGKLYVNDIENPIVEWVWSSGMSGYNDLKQIGGTNFYGNSWKSEETALFYIDNYIFDLVENLPPVDINEINPTMISIYPNPSHDNINVQSKNIITKIEIVNSFGKVVKNIVDYNFNLEINCTDLLPGIYIFSIETENGVSNHKVIIK